MRYELVERRDVYTSLNASLRLASQTLFNSRPPDFARAYLQIGSMNSRKD